MKKISLFFLASIFSIGVFAQTTPAATPVNSNTQPVKPRAAKTAATSSKNNLKKTGVNKKPIHHVTPVKKTSTPADAKGTSQGEIKK